MTTSGIVNWMRDVVECARSHASLSTVKVEIAGVSLELRFDDENLQRDYLKRLHMRPATQPAAGTLYVLSGERHFAKAAPPDLRGLPPELFHADLARRGILAAWPASPGHWQFFDRDARVAAIVIRDRSELPIWDGSAPMRLALQWLLAEPGLRVAHAASLGWDGKGLVLFGAGGAGKSGTTLAGLSRGLSTVGDDYIALRLEGEPAARPLYNIIKQDPEGVGRVAGLSQALQHLEPNWRGKYEFDPSLIYPGAFAPDLALRGVLLPKISARATPDIREVSPRQALLALISSNLHLSLTDTDAGLGKFSAFLRRLPCYQIELSPDAERNGGAIAALLKTL